MAWTPPYQLFGIWVSGDLDDITIYTDRFGRKVAFPKSPPEKPPSPEQTHARNRFREAQKNWKALTTEEKNNLEDASKKGNLVMTGQNLFISVSLTNEAQGYQTLQRQTGITLPEFVFVP